jgi:hypothetical protein
MAVTETLRALGSWGVTFRETMPDEVWKKIEYFGHICIHVKSNPGPMDDSLLKSARYVGPVRTISDSTEATRAIGGLGMATWLGDPDGKGDIIKDPLVVNDEFHLVIAALLPASGSITAGSIFNIGQNFSSTFQFQTPRDAIDYVCQTVPPDAGWRVNGDGTLDAGLESQIFQTVPTCIVINKRIARNVAAFEDMKLHGLAGKAETARDVEDYTTDVLLLAQGINGQFVQAEANTDPGDIPFFDIHGNKVKLERIVQESETDATNAPARAQLQLNRFSGSRDALTLSTSQYEIKGNAQVGDYLWVYDPRMGLIDLNNEVPFRAQVINPFKLRLTETTWPITAKMSVFYRAGNGEWVDLTKYVVPETGETNLVVGGYNRSLTEGGSGAFPVSPPPDTSVPDAAVWIEPFLQSTYQSETSGEARSEAILTWIQPDNVDSSTVTDGDHYEIRYRRATTPLTPTTWGQLEALGYTWDQWEATGATWDEPVQYVQTEWQTAYAPFDVQAMRLQELTPQMPYEAQIRLVDSATPPNVGAWSTVAEWLTTADDIPPSTPAAPTVAANTMAVQITHSLGKSTGGTFNLERDLHHLEVHAGNDHYYFPDDNTLIGRAIANYGMMVAQVPVVMTLQTDSTHGVYYKVIAVDNVGNKSTPSISVLRTADLIDDQYISNLKVSKLTTGTMTAGVVVGGRIGTMPDNGFPGVEMTPQGLEGWDTVGSRVLHWDSTTGILQVGQGGIEIRNGAMNIYDWAGNRVVEVGNCEDGRAGVQVFDASGVRTARMGELAAGGHGVEVISDLGELVKVDTLAFGTEANTISTIQPTLGTGYHNLATTGPVVTVELGNSGRMIVIVSCGFNGVSGTGPPYASVGLMGFDITGPSGYSLTAADLRAWGGGTDSSGGGTPVIQSGSKAFMITGIPAGAGSYTVTAKYKSDGAGRQFYDRHVIVIPF